MLDAYLVGCVNQLEERVRELRLQIPRSLPRDYDSLAQTCRQRLDLVLAALRSVRDDPVYRRPNNQPERLRRLRRAIAELDYLETAAVAALVRAREDDHKLNALLERIAREIDYPLVTPVGTTLSQQYFYISQDLNLLAVPLLEGRFLLHLPDLYHELAHPLLIVRDEPHVAAFQQAFKAALAAVLEYFRQEMQTESRRFNGPTATREALELWQLCWVRSWLTEFFCDLFAAATLGPAFAWSHLHLAAMRGRNPYEVPTRTLSTHPADDARMQAVLGALRQCGFAAEAEAIHAKWNELLGQAGVRMEPEYRRCFPRRLLQTISQCAVDGVRQMRCTLAAPSPLEGRVRRTLNEAWQQFWTRPASYVEWERQGIESLLNDQSPPAPPAPVAPVAPGATTS